MPLAFTAFRTNAPCGLRVSYVTHSENRILSILFLFASHRGGSNNCVLNNSSSIRTCAFSR